MSDSLLSDEQLSAHVTETKYVTNPKTKWRKKPGDHMQLNYSLRDAHGAKYGIYVRYSLADERAFSCGLILVHPSQGRLPLVRYNGANHRHGEIKYQCHIHRATHQAQQAGNRIDTHAVWTDRYSSWKGALECLIKDCNVERIPPQTYEKDMFDDS